MISSETVKLILEGDRLALSKALTLVESTKAEHRAEAKNLIQQLLPHSGKSMRIGITGAPGVGKSTFIEYFGKVVLEEGKSLAVLTIDPTSPNSGGSILGDKTRMPDLSISDQVMIRPSPSGLDSGGIAGNTHDQVVLCEAAGYDVIIIETVGTGQGETAIRYHADFVLLLLQAGGGDELQGIKRGIMEIAHGFAFTKTDVADKILLDQSIADLRNALHLLHAGIQSEIFACSASTRQGILPIWQSIRDFTDVQKETGKWEENRIEQELKYFEVLLKNMFWTKLMGNHALLEAMNRSKEMIRTKEISPIGAIEELLKKFWDGKS